MTFRATICACGWTSHDEKLWWSCCGDKSGDGRETVRGRKATKTEPCTQNAPNVSLGERGKVTGGRSCTGTLKTAVDRRRRAASESGLSIFPATIIEDADRQGGAEVSRFFAVAAPFYFCNGLSGNGHHFHLVTRHFGGHSTISEYY